MKALRKCNDCEAAAYTREDLEDFKKDSKGRYGRMNLCKDCDNKRKSKWRKNNPNKHTATSTRHTYKRDYGITEEEYKEAMSTSVCCESCGSTTKLVYDHSHITGDFRGVLCNSCNLAAGMMKDRAEEVYKLYKYLVDRGD